MPIINKDEEALSKGSIPVTNGMFTYWFPVGADGTVVTADSTKPLGVKWGPAGGSPFSSPAFTAFGITGISSPVEVGATISGSQTFTWTTSHSANVAANSISITDTTTSTTLGSGLANTGSDALSVGTVTYTSPATETWQISGTDTQANTFTDTFAVSWDWRVYAGTSSNVTLTANQIKALTDSDGLQAGFAGTYSLSAGNYKYFCYPDSMGSVAGFLAGGFAMSMATGADNAAYSNTANGWSYALVSVTNVNSIATNYRVYRSQYTLGGAITMVVS